MQTSSIEPGGKLQPCEGLLKAGQPEKAEQERARFTELSAVADAQRRQGSQVYQGPHDAGDMSVSQKGAGSTAAPN
jgi:hypothetical protein